MVMHTYSSSSGAEERMMTLKAALALAQHLPSVQKALC
jgi:hypothetical protein